MKNPWMSMWLSAANKAAGAARGLGTAELHRQQKTMANEAARAMGFGPSTLPRSGLRRSVGEKPLHQ